MGVSLLLYARAGIAAEVFYRGYAIERIEALTGGGAVAWAQHQRAALSSVLDALHVPEDKAVETVEKLQSEAKRLAREAMAARRHVFGPSSVEHSRSLNTLAGVFALLLWSLLTSISLFFGVAVCAQLEALRAGAVEPAYDDPGRPHSRVVDD